MSQFSILKFLLVLNDEVDTDPLVSNIKPGFLIALIKPVLEGSDALASLKGSVAYWCYEQNTVSCDNLAKIMPGKVDGIYEKNVKRSSEMLTLHPKYWLELIDSKHRYGDTLYRYFEAWCQSKSKQDFFFWLDSGDGTKMKANKCSSSLLNDQCVQYLAAGKRGAYEVIVENGKLVYNQSKKLLDTTTGSDFIFVLSPSYELYVGEKKKGEFHHSSFQAGGPVIAAGTLVVHNGILKKITRHSGHYRPTPKSSKKFQRFLKKKKIDLNKVEVDCYRCWAKNDFLFSQA